jgi:hypothetical protein
MESDRRILTIQAGVRARIQQLTADKEKAEDLVAAAYEPYYPPPPSCPSFPEKIGR